MLDYDVFDEPATAARTPWRARPIVLFESKAFFRRLSAEVLRFSGAKRVYPTGTIKEAINVTADLHKPMVITAWSKDEPDGLTLARDLRNGEGFTAKLEILMVSERQTTLEIEDARDAGVNGVLLRPFSATAMLTRLDEMTRTTPEFIETARFKGPTRRMPRPKSEPETGFKRNKDVEEGRVSAMQAALNQADDMAFQSTRRGDPVGARVGRSLRRFLEGVRGLDSDAQEIVALHRSTLARLNELRGADTRTRAELVNGLDTIVDKRSARAH